jgi:anthranilate phosphoribosyltransferase
MIGVQEALSLLAESPEDRLSGELLHRVASEILDGKASSPQIAAFLQGMAMQGETAHEINAFVEVMLEHCRPFPDVPELTTLVDVVGTGGDGHHTFNISTTAALLVAAAGVPVAKHGNRSASSKCGSADVLAELGFDLEQSPEAAAAQLKEKGFCFLFARSYHASMRHAAEARQALRIRTLFNYCGPLSNPARPSVQLVGVSRQELVNPMVETLKLMGLRRALVVHGLDGMDEISLVQDSMGAFLDADGSIHSWHFSPRDAGYRPVEMADLVGGDSKDNAEITREILGGCKSPKSDAVHLNAGAVLWLAGVESTLQQGVAHARALQESGKALAYMDSLLN